MTVLRKSQVLVSRQSQETLSVQKRRTKASRYVSRPQQSRRDTDVSLEMKEWSE